MTTTPTTEGASAPYRDTLSEATFAESRKPMETAARLTAALALVRELAGALKNSCAAMDCALNQAADHIAPFDVKVAATLRAGRETLARAEAFTKEGA